MGVTINGIARVENSLSRIYTASDNIPQIKLLDTSTPYYLGIDQSTKCCGIFIRSSNWSNFIMVEFQRRDASEFEYFARLRDFLYELANRVNITLFVREKPVNYNSRKYVNAKLNHFAGKLDGALEAHPKLSRAKRPSLNKVEWAAQMVFKEKSKNRARMKNLVAVDICEHFPVLKPMMEFSCKDFDAFEAVGILEGYMKKYMKTGTEIGGVENICKMLGVIVTYDNQQDLIEQLPQFLRKHVSLKEYNNEYTLYQNMRKCSSTTTSLVVIDDEFALITLAWRMNRPFKLKTALLVMRESSLKKSEMDQLKDSGLDYLVM